MFQGCQNVYRCYKENKIINHFFVTGDKFIFEIHLKQHEFTYSACGLFTENKERIQKFKETGDSGYIYQNKLDKACVQHDMAYRDFKDLPRYTTSDKVLQDKAFNFAKNPKYDIYQKSLVSMVLSQRSCFNVSNGLVLIEGLLKVLEVLLKVRLC